MRVYFFRVVIENSTDTTHDLVDRIYGLPQIDREWVGGNGLSVFLEDLRDSPNFFATEFTHRRMTHGPGHSQQGQPTSDFALRQGAGFGEQTAAVWSRQIDYVAIQYNHHGPRSGTIAKYLSNFLNQYRANTEPKLILIPVLDDTAMAQLESSIMQVKLECAIDGSTFSDEMVDHGVAVSSMLELSDETSANTVDLTLSFGMGRRSGPLNVMPMIDNLLRGNPRKLKVWVKDDFDSKMEMLDLIAHRYIEEVPEGELSPLSSGLRWDFDLRLRAIERRLEQWLRRQHGL